MILFDLLAATHFLADIRLVEDVAEVEATRLPVIDGLARLEAIHAADHLLQGTEPHLGHDFPHVLRDEAHEIHDVLRLAAKVRAQPRILGRNAHRAGVQMTDAHHHAAHRDQRRRCEAEFLGTEQCGDHHVATGLELTIGLDDDARTQIVQHQSLMCFSQAQFPWQTGVRH